MTTESGWVPDACTLPTVDQPLRVAEFDDLFARAAKRTIVSAESIVSTSEQTLG